MRVVGRSLGFGGRRGRALCGLAGWPFVNRQIFAHLFKTLFAETFDGEQVVDAFEGAVGFTHLKDFFGGDGANSRDLLELFGVGGIDIDGFERRLLGSS
jgi:hypothetical protein